MKYHFNNTNFKFMKTFKAALILLIFLFAPHMKAQQSRASDQAELETKNNMSYYQRRGLEDAQHEQELEVKAKNRGTYVLGRTKKIRKELKKNDRRAHRAYLQGKKRVMHHNYVTVIVIIAVLVSACRILLL
jgi:biopolymer transport protein ExbD